MDCAGWHVMSHRTCPFAGCAAQCQCHNAWKRGRRASRLWVDGVPSFVSSSSTVMSARRLRSWAALRAARKMVV
eukprot:15324433-Ditylum_brightwellii.AAC.1